jgi:hypothetical protein
MKLYSTKVQTQNDFFQNSYLEEINSYFFGFEIKEKIFNFACPRPPPPQLNCWLIDSACVILLSYQFWLGLNIPDILLDPIFSIH